MCLALTTFAAQAQVIRVDLKVTGVDGESMTLVRASSSAASGCASPDFPIMRHGEKVQVQLEDYKYLTVMSYEPSSNDELYVSVELEKPGGSKEMVEMSKYLRFNGTVNGERGSMILKDINMIEVFVEEE